MDKKKEKPSNLPSSKSEKAGVPATVTTAVAYSGPLPDPHTFEYYERVFPGAAKEIIEMAKSEQKHRHGMDSKQWVSHLLGQVFAFLLCLAGILAGWNLIYAGKQLTGFSVFLGSIGSLVAAAIITGKRKAPKAQ